MTIKVADKKGRIALGSQFAEQTFIVREEAGKILIEPAVVLPQREVWLYENEKALESVRRGLKQAQARQYSDSPPDLKADAALVEELDD